jgi:hypothetical protein
VRVSLERVAPRAYLGALRSAMGPEPVGWAVVLLPTPAALVNTIFVGVRQQMAVDAAVGYGSLAVAVQLTVDAVLLWGVLPILKRLFRLRNLMVLQLLSFAIAGAARACVLAAVATQGEPALAWLGWLALSWAVNNTVWMTSGAILVSWWRRARDQQMRLENEYERQVLTRYADARELANADRQLAQVRSSTTAALDQIQDRLHPGMNVAELDACIELINTVIAGLVRPASHDLAGMAQVPAAPVIPKLWHGWREMFPALLKNWPRTRPFHAGLVAMLCLPMVLAAEFVSPPHVVDSDSLVPLAVLGLQVVLLIVADTYLAPQMRRLPPRASVSVAAAAYVLLYLVGLTSYQVASVMQAPAPLEAFVMPALIAMFAGWGAAFVTLSRVEQDSARNLIRRTNWELRHTRQRLWAQRRRLATALHGRVQANLTAASVMLSMARDELSEDGVLNQHTVEKVREAVALAALIDQPPNGAADHRIAMVTSVWDGVLAVSLDLRPGGLELLSANPDLTDACTEVLREILLNSVRHSGATGAEVVIGAVSSALLCLRVTEVSATRQPLGGLGGPGLGRSLIDSLAVDWAEHSDERGRVTVAMLTAGATSSAGAQARQWVSDVSGLA